ncbi:YceI family protein [Membranicola marinus]|uniref:YceI family protein n=1 Tax=Membranihabitans marinus TaxID=1227546 RepID=A0A953HQG0_9BACT|nr:YceI family protein [Membranihabitans marinus]MBY5959359.1 YceI family protein [Membranihabitans marinus]
MLKIAALFIALSGMFFNSQPDPVQPTNFDEATKVIIDPTKSTLRWDGYKVTGQHHGSVAIESGELIFDGGQLKSGRFVMDMPSIEVHDLEGEYRTKLENHLKSDDFFGVASHPKATFEIDKAIPYGTTGLYKVEGQLTIKKITKPIKFEAQVDHKNGVMTATADIQIDRSEYNVRYGSGSFFDNLGDKTIYDEFDIKVKLVGNAETAN